MHIITYLQSGQEFDPTGIAMHRSDGSDPRPLRSVGCSRRARRGRAEVRKASLIGTPTAARGTLGSREEGRNARQGCERQRMSDSFDRRRLRVLRQAGPQADGLPEAVVRPEEHRGRHNRDTRGDSRHEERGPRTGHVGRFYCEEIVEEESDDLVDEMWVMGIERHVCSQTHPNLVMPDSGRCGHACCMEFGAGSPVVPGDALSTTSRALAWRCRTFAG